MIDKFPDIQWQIKLSFSEYIIQSIKSIWKTYIRSQINTSRDMRDKLPKHL